MLIDKTSQFCSNCYYFLSGNATENCIRYPTFVTRAATDQCGEWRPNEALEAEAFANLLQTMPKTAIIPSGSQSSGP